MKYLVRSIIIIILSIVWIVTWAMFCEIVDNMGKPFAEDPIWEIIMLIIMLPGVVWCMYIWLADGIKWLAKYV